MVKKMKRLFVVLLLIVAFVGGAACADALNLDFLSKSKKTYDMEILKEQITEISELASLRYDYEGDASFNGESKKIFDFEIPFSSKSMRVYYKGTIKMGSDLAGLDVDMNEDNTKLIITIPHSKILSHEIDNDSWEIRDVKNGLFNRVTLEDNNEFIKEQKKIMENKVKKDGRLEEADEKTAKQLANFMTMSYPELEVKVVFK